MEDLRSAYLIRKGKKAALVKKDPVKVESLIQMVSHRATQKTAPLTYVYQIKDSVTEPPKQPKDVKREFKYRVKYDCLSAMYTQSSGSWAAPLKYGNGLSEPTVLYDDRSADQEFQRKAINVVEPVEVIKKEPEVISIIPCPLLQTSFSVTQNKPLLYCESKKNSEQSAPKELNPNIKRGNIVDPVIKMGREV